MGELGEDRMDEDIYLVLKQLGIFCPLGVAKDFYPEVNNQLEGSLSSTYK
jgi:hypothetical protein